MAGNAVIGALRVVLGADTASLEKGLKSAQGSLDGFARNAKVAGAAIGAAMTGMAVGLGVAIKQTIDQADNLGKMAQSFGLPVEQLSALKHAADLSGVSTEELGKAMGRLSKNMVEAARDPMSQAALNLQAIGVTATNADGSLKDLTGITSEIAGRFADMHDGAGKTALAMELFGKSGANLIPLLNAGSDGLRDMIDEARALGIVIDTKTAKSAEAFNDNLSRLGKVFEGISVQVTSRLVKSMESLSASLVDAAKNGAVMDGVAAGIETAIKGIVISAMAGATVMQRFGAELAAFWKVVTAPDWSGIKAAWAEFQAAGSETEHQLAGLRERISKIWNDIPDFSIQFDLNALANVNSQVNQIGQNFLKLNAPIAASAESVKAFTAAADAMWQRQQQGAQSMFEMSLSPMEQYRLQLAEITQAGWQFGYSSEEIAKAQEVLAQRYGMTWQQQSASVAGSFASMGQSFADTSSSMAAVAKAAGIVQATIAMFVAGAEALKLGFPQGLAAAATMVAKGAALLASIKGTKIPAFKSGGSFTVPGGIGGGDKMPVSFLAEPGERVDIWRPDEGGADPRRAAGGARSVTIKVDGAWRPFVEALIPQINDAIRDGYQLKLAQG